MRRGFPGWGVGLEVRTSGGSIGLLGCVWYRILLGAMGVQRASAWMRDRIGRRGGIYGVL